MKRRWRTPAASNRSSMPFMVSASRPVRAALEEAARTASHLLSGLVDEEWGRRYGRPVRLGKNPTRPKTGILAVSEDACRLLEHLHQHGAGYRTGPQAEALRRIIVQNYCRKPTCNTYKPEVLVRIPVQVRRRRTARHHRHSSQSVGGSLPQPLHGPRAAAGVGARAGLRESLV
ncbi:hypothetical protein ACGFX4_22865 [Kitasatospora sp. NPDC048365]|uniref:hypothetical protein n=1 Tax=Kitasatospora sp. NPDC048365 TaxID=3364050 RepID=UPI00371813F4